MRISYRASMITLAASAAIFIGGPVMATEMAGVGNDDVKDCPTGPGNGGDNGWDDAGKCVYPTPTPTVGYGFEPVPENMCGDDGNYQFHFHCDENGQMVFHNNTLED